MKDNEINFDEIIYDGDLFIPFLSNTGNINNKISEYRNIYMSAEKDYFQELLADNKIRNALYKLLLTAKPLDLFKSAIILQEKIECGELESNAEKLLMSKMSPEQREKYHLSRLEKVEGILCLILAAIKDKGLILDEINYYNDKFSKINNKLR